MVLGAVLVAPGASVLAIATTDPMLTATPLIVTPAPSTFALLTSGPYFAMPSVTITGFAGRNGLDEQKDGFRWRG